MKKVFFSAVMLAACVSGAYAQDVPNQTPVVTKQDDTKVKVEPAALPDAVKKTLAGDAYKGWQATEAWHITGSSAYYKVDLRNGDKAMSVNIDKDGNVK